MEEYLAKSKGPCVILAGAGTGKTRAIVEKVEYLIKNKLYPAEEILCLTFSNEASRSMESRIMSALDNNANTTSKPTIRTFHALCSDILKAHGLLVGISQDFRILQPEDAMIMLHKNMKVPAHVCNDYVSAISTAKDLGIAIEEYASFIEDSKKHLPSEIEKELEVLQFELRTLHARKAERGEKFSLVNKVETLGLFLKRRKFLNAWRAYEKLKLKKNVLDYADLNKNALQLLKNHPDIIKFKYIVVDEFQDTNKVQLELLELLAPHKNITIVGDMNQSIYRFRGAYKNNLEEFKKIFNVTSKEIYTLADSYRSPNTVLRVSHSIIAHNYVSPEENITLVNAEQKEGEKVHVYQLKNGKEEVRKILEIIKHELSSGRKPEDICVMFRTHQQSSLLKKSLDHEGITYHSTTKKTLLKHPFIRRVINYLTILNALASKGKPVNAWWEVLHEAEFAQEDELLLSDYLRKNREEEKLSDVMLKAADNLALSPEGKLKYQAIVARIAHLLPQAQKNIPELIEEIYRFIGLEEIEKTKSGRESLLALQEFKKIITEQNNHEFFDLSTLLHHIDIMRALQLELEAPAAEEEGIKIMTAHAAKGLEYPIVILANLANKKFPIERFSSRPLIPPELMPELKEELKKAPSYAHEELVKEYEQEQQLRDERRLCYVALTRTIDNLYITTSLEYSGKPHEPSQFLYEAHFQENPNILFEQDNEEKYLEPVIMIKSASEYPQRKEPTFSPSSLKLFVECQKKYEYKYVLNMPDEKPASWEAIKLGSFVHKAIEQGIKEGFTSERSFALFARQESLKPEWENLDLNEALLLLKVFFERNKNKYNLKSKSEQHLFINLDGLKFHGIADRIDFHPDGLEIIDYKTGYTSIPPQERNWQLGLYVLGASKFGTVKRVTLDMLRHDRPLEFDLYEDGFAIERNTRKMSFSISDVQQELIKTAKTIIQSYKSGFKPCPIEKNCQFCDQYVWGK